MIENPSYDEPRMLLSEMLRSPDFQGFCCLLPPMVQKETLPKFISSSESSEHAMKGLKKGKLEGVLKMVRMSSMHGQS